MRVRPLLLSLSFLALNARAQVNPNIDQGFHPYGSYEGGSVDTVSLSNGALNINIPLAEYPQRGDLSLSFSLHSNSKIWSVAQEPGTKGNPNIGAQHWTLATQLGPYISVDQAAVVSLPKFTYSDPNGPNGQSFITVPVITDATGSQHLTGGGRSLDASGYALVTPTTLATPQGQVPVSSVVDRHGTLFTELGISSDGGSLLEDTHNTLTTDRNGNQILYTFNQSWVDSVGRTIPQPPITTTLLGVTFGNSTSTASCPAGTASAYSWVIPGVSGTSQTYTLCYQSLDLSTRFMTPGSNDGQQFITEGTGVVLVMNALLLPNGQQWRFGYDSYGDIVSLTYPTGGQVTYSWTNQSVCTSNTLAASRWLASRTVIDGTGEHVWTYTWAGSTVTVTDPSLNDTVHFFSQFEGCTLYETGTQYYQGSSTVGSTPLRTISTTYRHDSNPYYDTYSGSASNYGAINVVPLSVTTFEGGMSNTVINSYDQGTSWNFINEVNATAGGNPNVPATLLYGSVLEKDFSDWGPGSSGGAILRKDTTTLQWQNDSSYLTLNLLDAPAISTSYDGKGNQVAKTSYTYDEGQYLQQTSVLAQHGPAWSTQRGNISSVTRWLNTGPADLVTHTGWYDTGEAAFTIDANAALLNNNGHTTDIQLNECSGSVVTDTWNALGQHASAGYDCAVGLLSSRTDVNAKTQVFTYDVMKRIQTAIYPDGGNTSFSYDDTNHSATRTIFASPSPDQVITILFDGFGRESRRLVTDPNGPDVVDTAYDANGRKYSVSNPYRSTSDVTYGNTSFSYDALGRKILETKPDGSLRQWCFYGKGSNKAQTICSGNQSSVPSASWVDFGDEAGAHMQHVSDALGRLVAVVEPGSQTTTYSYDALDNLTMASQLGLPPEAPRIRSFTYDSLSRLITSTNPETGTICFGLWNGSSCQGGYDHNGNLRAKTDACGVSTSYTYDALNRLTYKSYSDGTHVVGFGYDGNLPDGSPLQGPGITNANSIGRLSIATTLGQGVDEVFSYDAMGRVSSESYCLPDNPCNRPYVSASYDLAGNMTDLTYPDGRHIHQTWNGAGQLGQPGQPAVADANSGQQFVESVAYNADSSPYTTTFGNGVQQIVAKNNRLQVQSMTTSTPLMPFSGQPFLAHTYSYINPANPQMGNNGNIWGVTDTLNGSRSQSFTYDSLNRISSFSLGGVLNQQFQVDSFGNMGQSLGVNWLSCFDSANNRLNDGCSRTPVGPSPGPAPPALGYDNAGNLTGDTDPYGMPRTYTYDAESRISSIAVSGNTPFETYTYNADGSRARKFSPADGTFTEYVNFNGQPIAERDQTGAWTDYIYAGGQKIARVSTNDLQFHIHGTLNGGPSDGRFDLAIPQKPGGGAYVVQAGDQLCWRQTSPNVSGGIAVWFNNGQDSILQGWHTSDGLLMHYMSPNMASVNRCVDLTGGNTDTGAQIIYIALLAFDSINDTPTNVPAWDAYYSDMAILSQNGQVTPIINGGSPSGATATATFADWYGTPSILSSGLAALPASPSATHFFVGDHLGTAQMEFSSGGWPVWQGQFAPFGGELVNNQPLPAGVPDGSSSHYKFTGKERDTESGLDYFGRRYYGSSMGRFMSPDPHNPILIRQGMIAGGVPEEAANSSFLGFIENPQNWNEYSYVRNNPLGFTDPTGAFPAPGDGHHLLVERGNISNPLAKDFANSLKTGGPNPASNTWSNASGHPAYNNAVNELENELEQTQGDSNTWSLSQWKDFATKILNSDEPAIKGFLDQIETELPGSRATLTAAIAGYQPTKAVVARTYAWAIGAGVSAAFQDLFSDFMFCFTCNITHYKVTSKIVPIT